MYNTLNYDPLIEKNKTYFSDSPFKDNSEHIKFGFEMTDTKENIKRIIENHPSYNLIAKKRSELETYQKIQIEIEKKEKQKNIEENELKMLDYLLKKYPDHKESLEK